MLLKLTCNTTDQPSYEFGLQQLPALIGRSAQAHIRLDDRWASRRHCELFILDGTVSVRDLNSRHGIYVNGQLVEQAQLSPGDVLAVGLNEFQIDMELAAKSGDLLNARDSSVLCDSDGSPAQP